MEAGVAETFYFLVEGVSQGTNWDAVGETLEEAGVRSVKPTGLTLLTREVEVAAVVNKGKATPATVAQGLLKAGLKAELEGKDTWSLFLGDISGKDPGLKALRRVAGVEEATGDNKGMLQVTGYSPHVSTSQLMTALQSAGVSKVKVQTEEVQVKVKGAETPEQVEQARAKLAQAAGVVEAKSDKSGVIVLVREKGRGGLPALNRALKAAGWSAELVG